MSSLQEKCDPTYTPPARINWLRVIAGGMLWMFVYNILWGIAWFAFMRREWLNSVAAIKQRMPWTQEVWTIWIAVTFPLGIVIVAYLASQARRATRTAIYASVTLWLLMTLGMVGLAWQNSYSVRVITFDSVVNLAALAIASLVSAWSQRIRPKAKSEIPAQT